MDFILHLIQTAEFASWLAFSAFLFSGLSLLWTRRSAIISQKSLKETIHNNQRVSDSEIEQKRFELLKAISEEHSMIETTLTSLGALKADYDASHEVVKSLMDKRGDVFTGFMPMLETYKTDVENRHVDATNWKLENGIPELMQLLTEQDVATKNTQQAINCNVSVVAEFREKLELAINHQQSAMR